MKDIIEDILIDYGGRDEKGTYTSGQFDLLVSRLNSEMSNYQNQGRMVGKTWRAFVKCLQWAQQGKTFIFIHTKFVAIDMKTWNRLKREKLPTMTFYDEVGEITEEQWAELDKIIPKRGSDGRTETN